ncbi:MAG TPA: HlyD family type I secretion periplasmic adaptor subunit [Geminicoccaceae bacterium]|nr:HlyD family type I secretion periplasmic adaptor subunit [Geminicoccaceae bacterium]
MAGLVPAPERPGLPAGRADALPAPLPRPPAAAAPPRPPVGRFVAAGMVVILLFFGAFGAWAALAPLSSAALAPGTVRAEGNRRTVQHLEGGLIQDLPVREGDRVKRGQVLVRLDRTAAVTRFEGFRHQYDLLKASEARLLAERDRAPRVRFPVELVDQRSDPRVGSLLVGQEQIFLTRRQSYDGQKGILEQRTRQLRAQIEGLEAQGRSADRQLELIRAEERSVAELVKKNLERQARLLELQRRAAALEGARAETDAGVAQALQAIGETELRILALDDEQAERVAGELERIQAELARIEEELTAAADVLRRRDLEAPIAGTVVNLRFFTRGGVIQPGTPVLDIVPAEDRLLVEAQVSPMDIDIVRPGLVAEVQLSAYKQRRTPVLEAEVLQVSADRFTDERSGAAYYKALVAIDPLELAKLEEVELYPGMPIEVMIRTGERTFLEYLLTPIRDSFRRAFVEQ